MICKICGAPTDKRVPHECDNPIVVTEVSRERVGDTTTYNLQNRYGKQFICVMTDAECANLPVRDERTKVKP